MNQALRKREETEDIYRRNISCSTRGGETAPFLIARKWFIILSMKIYMRIYTLWKLSLKKG